MHAKHFDTLTRSLTASDSRRRIVALALSSALAPLLGLMDGEAHDPLKRCKRKSGKQKKKCIKKARNHNTQHATETPPCVPQSLVATCAGRCGIWLNNCGQETACFVCPTGQICLSNGSCARECPTSNFACGTGNCICSLPSKDGPRFCRKTISSCASVPQRCTTTVECPLGQYCGPVDCSGSRCLQLCTT